ncbi:MAG: prenyltransferase/squalene oxidase repeat-containing protein [Solirubrobacteraceae bacterium]
MRLMTRLALLALAACALFLPASAAATSTSAQIRASVGKSVGYLKSQQESDGGFGTSWVLGALAAAGTPAAAVTPRGGSSNARAYERNLLGDTATWPGESEPPVTDFEQATLNSYAAGIDPARVSKTQNLIAQIASYYQPANPGYYGSPSVFSGTVFGLLALAQTKTTKGVERVPRPLLERSIAVLRANQHNDGGWGYEKAEGSPSELAEPGEPDETGAAIAALCSAGVANSDPAIVAAKDYLKSDIVASSGAFETPFGPNTDSDAWAVEGLNACHIAAQGSEFTTTDGKTPIDFLISQQLPEGGFVYEAGESAAEEYSSQDAVRALAGGGFTAVPPKPKGAPQWLAEANFESGVSSPLALIIDNSTATLAVCSVAVTPAGSTTTLAAVLHAAESSATPSGCVTSFAPSSGSKAITQIDGSPTPASAAWHIRIDGGAEKTAKRSSRIKLGDTIYLRES